MNNDIISLSELKTRILVVSQNIKVEKLISHLFHQNGVDYNLASDDVASFDNSKDFVLFFQKDFTSLISPNIVLILPDLAVDTPSITTFFNSITAGGIVVYSENNSDFASAIESTTRFYRSLTFTPNTDTQQSIQTEFGAIELPQLDVFLYQNLQGIALLCQQVGVLGDHFYEAILSFKD